MSEVSEGQEGPATVCAYVAPAEGLDVPAQRRRLMAWSNRTRTDVSGACEDVNRSGRHRPGLRQALTLVHTGAVGGVVILHPRVISDDPIEQTAYAWAIARAHGHLIVAEPAEVDNITGIIAESDQQRRAWQHVLSTEARVRYREEDPGRYTGGRLAFGRAVDGGRLVDNANEMAVVTRITELRSQGSTYAYIAEMLNAEDYPTASGRGRWHPQTIKRIVERYESGDPNIPVRPGR